MNEITQLDFVNLLRISEGEILENYDPQAATEAVQEMQKGKYFVDDVEGKSKRRAKQQVFSNKVKSNYQNKCAICGLSTKQFLVGSHIVPWSTRKESRLDPSNGICLCTFHDKAFDEGFITIQDDLTVVVSKRIRNDGVLIDLLRTCDGIKLTIRSKTGRPSREFLRYHRENVFEKCIQS